MKKIVFILTAALAALTICLAAWQRSSVRSERFPDKGISQEITITVHEGMESEQTAGILKDLWNGIVWWWRYNVAGWKNDGQIMMTTDDGQVLVINEVHLG